MRYVMRLTRLALWLGAIVATTAPVPAEGAEAPTFYKDVLPILQKNCQVCHRPGQMAPMPLLNFEQVRPWARAIKAKVVAREMPPWHADPKYGRFANDKRLSDGNVAMLSAWVDAGAPPGDPKDAPAPVKWPADGWSIPPDVIVGGAEFKVPAKGVVEWANITVPSGFTKDTWVTSIEILPSAFPVVHHMCLAMRAHEPGVTYGVPRWTDKPRDEEGVELAPTTSDEQLLGRRQRQGGGRQVIHCYLPGEGTVDFRPYRAAMLIPAGSDFDFALHYTVNGKEMVDRPRIGFTIAKEPPERQFLFLNVTPPSDRKSFAIPPRDSNWRGPTGVGTFLENAELLFMNPHMHNRGKAATVRLAYPDGRSEIVLHVPKYDYNWQFFYTLEKPRRLPKETKVLVEQYWDNSASKKGNPNPNRTVYWGEQMWEEMGGSFVGVLVDPNVDPKTVMRLERAATQP